MVGWTLQLGRSLGEWVLFPGLVILQWGTRACLVEMRAQCQQPRPGWLQTSREDGLGERQWACPRCRRWEQGRPEAGRHMPCTPVSFLDPVSGEILTACADNQARGQEVALQLLYQRGHFLGAPKLAWGTSLLLALI